eukprot:5840365-Prymnesium_polylepis.1
MGVAASRARTAIRCSGRLGALRMNAGAASAESMRSMRLADVYECWRACGARLERSARAAG